MASPRQDRCLSGPGTTRAATADDAARMHDIDAQTSQHPRSEESYAACCRGGSAERALVWPGDGEVCGFVVYSAVLDQASIHNIAICPALQRQGVGRALLGDCLAAMRRAGLKTCLLEVRASNAAALGLYRNLGFAVDGRRRNYYRGPSGREDALLMSLALGGNLDERA